MIPFFSRRIGLVGGQEVPIIAGGEGQRPRRQHQLRRRSSSAPNDEPGVVDESARRWPSAASNRTSGASRMSASIATAGDPLGRTGSWLSGVDFTYSTSRFLGNKNFSSVPGASRRDATDLRRRHDGLTASRSTIRTTCGTCASGTGAIGRDFDPSLGFVPRRAMQRCESGDLEPARASPAGRSRS